MRQPAALLVASDLDRTLIYSRRALALTVGEQPPLICVEHHRGEGSSFMTARAGQLMRDLSAVATVMAVTTRTPEQLDRVRLPGRPHRFAVAANGGLLFIDGQVDAGWSRQVRGRLAESASLNEVLTYTGQASHQPWMLRLRTVPDLFCYAEVDRPQLPADWLLQATEWAAERGWRVTLHGRKLYWLPRTLTKSAAVREVVDRIGAGRVLAAGDSSLDIDLLENADLGIHPRHGDLFASGWSAPHVTPTAEIGVLAGQAILERFRTIAQEHAEAQMGCHSGRIHPLRRPQSAPGSANRNGRQIERVVAHPQQRVGGAGETDGGDPESEALRDAAGHDSGDEPGQVPQ
ncbi:hypothetical protein ABZ570_11065 [Micromonospora sp. NPDC007271]|uniref:hypothetical protein n=1 Tax=Micromonospora sp. NPDC007271 TaxID=3154587 RepID=UPI0033ED2026